MNLLQQRQLADEDEEDDSDDEYYTWASPRHEKPPPGGWFPQPKEPQEAGVDLLFGGSFGHIAYKSRERGDIPNRNIAQTIRRRLEGRHHRPRVTREDMANVRRRPSGSHRCTFILTLPASCAEFKWNRCGLVQCQHLHCSVLCWYSIFSVSLGSI